MTIRPTSKRARARGHKRRNKRVKTMKTIIDVWKRRN